MNYLATHELSETTYGAAVSQCDDEQCDDEDDSSEDDSSVCQYMGDQRTAGALVSPRRTLTAYNNNMAIPAAVMSRLVLQVNQVADAPVQDLFLRQKLAPRLARNGSTHDRGGP